MKSDLEVRIVPLFSGSSGNSVFFQFEDVRFLVDAGCSCRRIVTALKEIDCNLDELSAVFITHSHNDHISGLDVLMRKCHVPVFATAGTWTGVRPHLRPEHNIQEFGNIILQDQAFQYRGIEIFPFSTSHDAPDSVGYRFSKDGVTMSIATDLGWFSETVRHGVKGSDVVYIESNYNYDMLWEGEYPWYLKKRIGSRTGHLSNFDCADAISDLISGGTKYFILGHLSQENNTPQVAQSDVEATLRQKGLENGMQYELFTANRSTLSDSFTWSGGHSFLHKKTGWTGDVKQIANKEWKSSGNSEVNSRQIDIFQLLGQMESDGKQLLSTDLSVEA